MPSVGLVVWPSADRNDVSRSRRLVTRMRTTFRETDVRVFSIRGTFFQPEDPTFLARADDYYAMTKGIQVNAWQTPLPLVSLVVVCR